MLVADVAPLDATVDVPEEASTFVTVGRNLWRTMHSCGPLGAFRTGMDYVPDARPPDGFTYAGWYVGNPGDGPVSEFEGEFFAADRGYVDHLGLPNGRGQYFAVDRPIQNGLNEICISRGASATSASVEGFLRDTEGGALGCHVGSLSQPTHWRLSVIDPSFATVCTILERVTNGVAPNALSGAHLLRVRDGFAWIQSDFAGPYDVWVYHLGDPAPRVLSTEHSTYDLAGGGEYLAWQTQTATRSQGDTLFVSRYPFTTAQRAWVAPAGRTIINIKHDPTRPSRIIFSVGRAGTQTCNAGGDIYLADLDQLDTQPPRALTDDLTTQDYAVVRGRWVAWIDNSAAPVGASGCTTDARDGDVILLDQSTGERRSLVRAPFATTLYLGARGLWFLADFGLVVYPLP